MLLDVDLGEVGSFHDGSQLALLRLEVLVLQLAVLGHVEREFGGVGHCAVNFVCEVQPVQHLVDHHESPLDVLVVLEEELAVQVGQVLVALARAHQVKDTLLFLPKTSDFLILMLNLALQPVDLLVLLLLQLLQPQLHLLLRVANHLSSLRFCILECGCLLLDLHILLRNLLILLLRHIGKSLALDDQLFDVGCAVLVVVADPGRLGGVEATGLEVFTRELCGIVVLIHLHHKFFVILVSRKSGGKAHNNLL